MSPPSRNSHSLKSPKSSAPPPQAAAAWFALFICFGLAMCAYHAQLLVRARHPPVRRHATAAPGPQAANLTTNEHMNAARYAYLRDPATGAFRNPYDRGCALANVSDFR